LKIKIPKRIILSFILFHYNQKIRNGNNCFDLLLSGRRKSAPVTGTTPTQQTLTKARLRIVQQVRNNQRVVYRNRVETSRRNLVVLTIENVHNREKAAQQV
jgi:hypothetical protein